jgi:SAM-dependent methyltransferase
MVIVLAFKLPDYSFPRHCNVQNNFWSFPSIHERTTGKLFRSISPTIIPTTKVCYIKRSMSQESNNNKKEPTNNKMDTNHTAMSRRDVFMSTWKIPVATVGVYVYGRFVYNAMITLPSFWNGNMAPIYPPEHERRIELMLQTAFVSAAASAEVSALSQSVRPTVGSNLAPFRVLEIGIGTDARLLRRGLYDTAIQQLLKTNVNIHELELVGLDLQVPTKRDVLNDTTKKINQLQESLGISIDFKTIQSSITTTTPFSDNYFDVIVFCFTLCSVDDPMAAIYEIQRLLRPHGGTIGYLEHVAVEATDVDHQFLSYQQQLLDPIQQKVADHCHLHRTTENTINTVLTDANQPYRTLYRERFYVDPMWPVSCQASGVIQFV